MPISPFHVSLAPAFLMKRVFNEMINPLVLLLNAFGEGTTHLRREGGPNWSPSLARKVCLEVDGVDQPLLITFLLP